MSTNVTHNDFIFSIKFEPSAVWIIAIAAVLIVAIVLLVRARKRRAH